MLLVGLYARGGAAWPLGFVMLVPWLRALDASHTWPRTLLLAWAMSVAFTAAAFAWFGLAIGRYTQWGDAAGVALLLAAAPLFQPQFIALAMVRRAARRHGPLLGALAGTAAWVATERFAPRLLGDTLGHGLHPAVLLRQAADLAGAAGLTALLLLANEGVTCALARHGAGWRAWSRPLLAAAAVPLLLAAYGLAVQQAAPHQPDGAPLRIGLVQTGITDYERLRRERGAGAAVRQVLDVHYAMSYDAVERQRVQAVLWTETAYPTTFGRPKSEAGAELDREILGIVDAARVPFVFGTYDRDDAGEYNAAAFVAPGVGRVGMYRKARPFPFTEHVPAWLDGPLLRRLLPWAGTWLPGDGARVFPLRLADGRELPVQPLICRDDMDSTLAIDGARLGARALLVLSNDAWFDDVPMGPRLHLAAAAFRSIETRLPQWRVTPSGYSAVIDAQGTVVASARLHERTLVVGELPVGAPVITLMVRWGDWVGAAAAGFLVALAAWWWFARSGTRRAPWGDSREPGAAGARNTAGIDAAPMGASVARGTGWQVGPGHVAVLPAAARVAAGTLRVVSRGGLLVMAAALLSDTPGWAAQPLQQLRWFGLLFVVPEAVAWCLLRAFAACIAVADGALVLASGARRLTLPAREVAAVEPWRLPLPSEGATLRLADGTAWRHGLACADALALQHALHGASSRPPGAAPAARVSIAPAYTHARLSTSHGRLHHPLAKFAGLSLLLALPAFRLHQHIAYGSGVGEWLSFGARAWFTTFLLWWAAWAAGVILCAAALRAGVEVGTLLAALLQPARAAGVRRALERAALVTLYLGLPGWLAWRLLVA